MSKALEGIKVLVGTGVAVNKSLKVCNARFVAARTPDDALQNEIEYGGESSPRWFALTGRRLKTPVTVISVPLRVAAFASISA